MSKKKQNQIKISFIGENSQDVTGSMILIEMNNKTIILECGLYQSNNLKYDYKINSRKFKFKSKDIDIVFINHVHIDHSGLLPRLFAEGCNAKVIMVKDSSKLLEPLLRDSAFIMQRDIESLSRKSNINFKPIYHSEDVDKCLEYIEEYNYNKIYTIDDEVSFEFIPAGHIIRSAQLILYLKQNNCTRKILYTSDIGNIKLDKYYTEALERANNANIVIGECTYSDGTRKIKNKDRVKDLEKIKSVIKETCIDKKSRVLIPIFSLDRSQNILTHLYKLFGEDKSFTIPIILDSPLSIKITEIYNEILDGEDKILLDKVLKWKNVKLIKESDESKMCVNDMSPKVILSASGMMVSGRSRFYVKSILPDSNAMILFVGFATPGSLAGKIKDGKNQKTITIDGKSYKNNCSIVCLNSFTCHMQHDDLLEYYSDINCEKIALVHGKFNDKIEFCNSLQNIIESKNKTSKVICVNQSTSLLI